MTDNGQGSATSVYVRLIGVLLIVAVAGALIAAAVSGYAPFEDDTPPEPDIQVVNFPVPYTDDTMTCVIWKERVALYCSSPEDSRP